jgi:hypothetical protein
MMALIHISHSDVYGVSLTFTDTELADRFDDYLISNWEGEPSVRFEGDTVTYTFGPMIQERQVRMWLCQFIVEDASKEAVADMKLEGISPNEAVSALEGAGGSEVQKGEVIYWNTNTGVTFVLSSIGKQLLKVYREAHS